MPSWLVHLVPLVLLHICPVQRVDVVHCNSTSIEASPLERTAVSGKHPSFLSRAGIGGLTPER